MQVSHPQRTTFGTLTATEIHCPTYDSVTGDLTLKRAGFDRFMLEAGVHRHVKDVQLDTGVAIVDASDVDMITQGGSGIVQCPAILKTNDFRSISGNMTIRREASDRIVLGAGGITMKDDLVLDTNIELQDASTNPLLAGDNSGNIDQLGRIDADLVTPDSAEVFTFIPAQACASTQSGTLSESDGYWITVANDSLYIFLTLPIERANGFLYIDTIEMSIDTTDSLLDYITKAEIMGNDMTSSTEASEWNDTSDAMKGDTGHYLYEYTVDLQLAITKLYVLRLDAVVNNSLQIEAIRVRGHYT